MTTSLVGDRFRIYLTGHVSPREVDYVRAKIASVTRYAEEPIVLLRLRLTKLDKADTENVAIVQASLDMKGHIIRAQVSRPTMREAADEAHDRLRDKVERVDDDRQVARRGHRAHALLEIDHRGTAT